ncbi:MAG TPA: methylisocitrate lyase [Acidimicrobiales bacterium]
MLHSPITPSAKRLALRERLDARDILILPGAFNPLSAMLIEQRGYEAAYLSGAVIAADLGLPDVGLTTLSEVAQRSGQVARVTALPLLVDADTGFGEAMNVARTIQMLEDAGVAGVHVEDQVNPKRCGHLDGKHVVAPALARQRVAAAVSARRDPNLMIVARTDARATDSLDEAIDRARSYVDVGADAIFPEALLDESEFAAFREAIGVPLLANATEFGKGDPLSVRALNDLGVDMVIFPVSLLRLAMGAAERGLRELAERGELSSLFDAMQSRDELYELLDYQSYQIFDSEVFNFRSTD